MHALINTLLIEKITRFGAAGSVGFVIDFSSTWLLKEKICLNKYIATSAGFCAAVINNFLLNYFWTFHAHNNLAGSLTVFFMIAVTGLALHNLLIYWFTRLYSFNFYVARLIAVAIIFVWNFTMNYFFNFRIH